ncbi:MAG: tRNA pseudouridine(55) synthase TruB [Deltaproteobacteria bacterium]|nr:tRNA pseudouridine(55) synthase TruB [Deltaproteobacteria bacterium]
MAAQQQGGVLVVDKPAGITSAAAVDRLKRALGVRRAGHAGTLDPMATGVLVVCVGEATKIATYLLVDEKQYLATARLGIATDTFDADGYEVGRAEIPPLDEPRIEAVLRSFVGLIDQKAPAYSALKKDGQALHRRARRGEAVEPPTRAVEVRSLELVRWEPPDVVFRVVCGKGTYVRSLAVDIAARLGTLAHLVALRRERSGAFSIGDAVPWRCVAESDRSELVRRLIPPADALAGMDLRRLDEAEARAITLGQPIAAGGGRAPGHLRLVAPSGALLAIGERRDDRIWPIRVLNL